MLYFVIKFQGIWICGRELIGQKRLNIFHCIIYENNLYVHFRLQTPKPCMCTLAHMQAIVEMGSRTPSFLLPWLLQYELMHIFLCLNGRDVTGVSCQSDTFLTTICISALLSFSHSQASYSPTLLT